MTDKQEAHPQKTKKPRPEKKRKKKGRQQRWDNFYVKNLFFKEMKKIVPYALIFVTSLCPLQAANN